MILDNRETLSSFATEISEDKKYGVTMLAGPVIA